ncbi:MAG: hypothetical protein ACRDOK_20540 [Streptosporangiaceae bacterium]
MSWAANGTFPGQTEFAGAGTVGLNNTAVGDLILMVAVSIDSASNWVNSVTGGGATWTQIGSHFVGSVNGMIATTWQGKVTATGSQTATIGVTGGSPTIDIVTQEFSSTVGSWSVDMFANLDSPGTNTWPSLTPAAAGELYFGFVINGAAIAGSTPGYTYEVTTQGNGCAFNPSCGASATDPVWSDSSQKFGRVVLVRETPAASSPRLLMASYP